MTKLERAVSGSENIAFCMKLKLSFPAEILSGGNPFSDGTEIRFGDIVHPDDYQPFCEVISNIVNGTTPELKAHARLNTTEGYVWYYIAGKAQHDSDGRLLDICGMMFNVSDYLDCDTEDAVLRQFRSKHAANLEGAEEMLKLKDILGEDYLTRIQKPFTQIKGLFSAITDSDGRIFYANGKEKGANLHKMNYQRSQTLRVRHSNIGNWTIAGNSAEIVNENAQLLETMAQTVAGIANSYIVIVNEMENSQNANKLLGQTFEDQILINNVYSLILNGKDTREAMSGIVPLISEFFGLEDMMFSSSSRVPAKIYRWDNEGLMIPVVVPIPYVPEISKELDYSGIYCAERKEIQPSFNGTNRSCVMVRTYESGKSDGVIIYVAKDENRSWSNRERKLIKSLTQILSTVIYKVFIEDELATSRARLERIAYYDASTGIPNRSMFERDFAAEISENRSGAVIAFEISNLKTISENYGCEYADEVIRSFAEYVSAVPCSAKKKVYRFTNDILFAELSGAGRDEARQFAQAILTKFRSPWYLDENEQLLQVYAGVTEYPADAANIDHCINAATQTLRLAKERKLEDAACYSEGLEEKLSSNQLVKKLIADSADHDFKGFYFLYQPVIDINSGELHCCEANLYWTNGELTVPREQFQPIIDQLGISEELYRFSVDKICEFCATVREAGAEHFRVSITIPDNVLSTEASIEAIRSSLLEFSLPPTAVSISVSESAKTLYNGNMFLQQMAKMGVNVIADDLSESYFTVAPLENPAVKTVKIRSSRFSEDAISTSFLHSVIRLAHEKGIAVCARGVDSPAIFQSIRKFKVDLVEGTFNGRPLRDKEFLEKLVTSVPARKLAN